MVQFSNSYSRGQGKNPDIEQPIFTINEIGQTIPEHDATGRHKDVIETAQAAIRGGSGVLQIVMMNVPGRTGRGAHMYGKDFREAFREVIKANEVVGVGVELPTSLNNVTGWSPQAGRFDEQTRKNHLDEIKSAINFTGDVFSGGGTDVVSFEFARRFHDADWNQNASVVMKKYEGEKESSTVNFVDPRTGVIQEIPVNRGGIFLQKEPGTNNPTQDGEYKPWKWEDFVTAADGDMEKAHEMLKEEHFKAQRNMSLASIARRKDEIEKRKRDSGYDALIKKDPAQLSDKERRDLEFIQTGELDLQAQEQKIRNDIELIDTLQSMSKYGKERVWQSYAELGIFAMDDEGHRKDAMKEHLYVGPELGWPEYYGGHPDEFIEIITNAREVMVQRLVGERGLSKSEAEKLAKQHIRGTFDSGHLGMWLKHFEPDKHYADKKEAFDKWYLENVEKIAKADVVGNVQLVDAHGGEHGHLPPGQGIFPLKEAMDIMKKNAPREFHLVSEGHEEERQEVGRIRTQAWRLLGASTGRGQGAPLWSNVERAYLNNLYSPKMMFGNSAPPFGEYRPWNDIPFE